MKIGDTLYQLIKKGKRNKFVPVNVLYELSRLQPGMWLCTKKPYGYSSSNLDYRAEHLGLFRVGEVPEIDYVNIAKIIQLGDKIGDIILNYEKEHNTWTVNDLSEHIAKELIECAKPKEET